MFTFKHFTVTTKETSFQKHALSAQGPEACSLPAPVFYYRTGARVPAHSGAIVKAFHKISSLHNQCFYLV